MKPLNPEDKIKQCTKCNKKYIEHLGFYKRGDGFETRCKSCHSKYQQQHNIKDVYEYHSWNEININISICKKCNLKKKSIAGQREGKWIVKYLIDNKWQFDKPKCILKED